MQTLLLLSALLPLPAAQPAKAEPVRLGTPFCRHEGLVHTVAFLPDSKTLLTFADDGRLRLWDMATGKQIWSRATAAPFPNIALSPDGKTIAVEDAKLVPVLWNWTTGRDSRLPGAAGGYCAFAFSPDGKYFAALTPNGNVELWDLPANKKLPALGQDKFQWAAGQLVFAPDSKTLAVLRRTPEPKLKERCQVWDVAGAKKLAGFDLDWRPGRFGREYAVFAADSKTLYLGSEVSGQLLAVHAATGKEAWKVPVDLGPRGHDTLSELVLSPDGRALVGRTWNDGVVRRWDDATGKALEPLLKPGNARVPGLDQRYAGPFYDGLSMSPDGKLLALAWAGSAPRVFDLATGKELGGAPAQLFPAMALSFSPDGKRLRAWTADRAAWQWDLAAGKSAGEWAEPDRPYLAVGGGSRTLALTYDLRLLDLSDDARVLARLPAFPLAHGTFAFSPDGSTLAVWSPELALPVLYDVPAGNKRCQVGYSKPERSVGNTPAVGAPLIVFSPDGSLVAVTVAPGRMVVADAADGRQVCEIPVGGTPVERFLSAAFSPDNRTLVVDTGGGSLAVWEVATGRLRRTLGDGKLVKRELQRDYTELGRLLREPPGKLAQATVAFTPDGRRLVWAPGTDTVRLWRAATGTEAGEVAVGEAAFTALAVSPDGKTLALGSRDTTVLLVPLPAAAVLPRGPKLDELDLAFLWQDLASADAAKAAEAIGQLAQSPAEAVPFFKKHLAPVPAVDPERVLQLVAQLGSKKTQARLEAREALIKLGAGVAPTLQTALAAAPEDDLRLRLEAVLDKVQPPSVTAEALRQWRALEALEHMDSPEARQLLEALANGAPGARQTESARASLARRKG